MRSRQIRDEAIRVVSLRDEAIRVSRPLSLSLSVSLALSLALSRSLARTSLRPCEQPARDVRYRVPGSLSGAMRTRRGSRAARALREASLRQAGRWHHCTSSYIIVHHRASSDCWRRAGCRTQASARSGRRRRIVQWPAMVAVSAAPSRRCLLRFVGASSLARLPHQTDSHQDARRLALPRRGGSARERTAPLLGSLVMVVVVVNCTINDGGLHPRQ